MTQKGLPVRQAGLAPILIVVLIVLALGGYLIYQKQDKTLFPFYTPSPTPNFRLIPHSTPENVVKDFYDWYTYCWKEHQDGRWPGDASKDCNYTNSSFVSDELERNLKDNVMCASNFPKSIKVDGGTISGNQASLTAHHIYESSGDNPIRVELKNFNDQWKITNIICLKSP